MERGKFIVLEGIGGSGKTTQAKLLVENLKILGITAVYEREPTDNPIGKLVRTDIEGQAQFNQLTLAHLFAADRAMHQDNLERLLGNGATVVCDRYILSSLVYQSNAVPYGLIERLNKDFMLPDITLYIDINPKVALQRLRRRGFEDRFDRSVRDLWDAGGRYAWYMSSAAWVGKTALTVTDTGLPITEMAEVIGDSVMRSLQLAEFCVQETPVASKI